MAETGFNEDQGSKGTRVQLERASNDNAKTDIAQNAIARNAIARNAIAQTDNPLLTRTDAMGCTAA
jgi:hypothetical protein